MTQTILIIVIVIAAAVAIAVFLNKKLGELAKTDDDKAIMLIQQQLGQLMQSMDSKISQTNQTLDKKLSEANRVTMDQLAQFSQMSKHSQQSIQQVTEKLTKLDETNRQVVDFSAQLKNLQDILKNPKQRGVLGEYYLEETLKNVLPPNSYQMQYKFTDSVIVDAVIFVKDKIIPVDSKFSLETYEKILNCNDHEQRKILQKRFKQDLKNRIDETSKYIKTAEKTVDFAFMFIPSESIYYDLLTSKVGVSSRDLIEYAFKEKHVIIVSPTSFLAYLQTVLQGLRALQIEESAKEIQKQVEKLGRHLQAYETFHQKMGSSLATTVNHYNKTQKELGKIDKDVMKITDSEDHLLTAGEEIEKPKTE